MQHPTIPAQAQGWPANELERVLVAAVGDPGATPRVVEVLRRSQVWVPLPGGRGPDGGTLALPTTELAGQPFVPVFSSEDQFRRIAGNMAFTVAPVHELALGMPLGVGIVVNPEGAVGIPIPAAGVVELRAGAVVAGPVVGSHGAPLPEGARVGLRQPEPHEEPLGFLAAAVNELAGTGLVLTARRVLAQVEAEPEKLFVGVELDRALPETPELRDAVVAALGRALGAEPLPWALDVVLLDSAYDPVGDWMRMSVAPFFERDRSGH
ncbi:enhanced serine sensitivity protein SseB [Streptacidiphilus cavernicola]|uniref:Enhanced serine sensitivity protein SseB n=1 Tax=Streptacidiphilus cavernicola TaxID=3342716 RepID=A0ABV6W2K4_9ACTN